MSSSSEHRRRVRDGCRGTAGLRDAKPKEVNLVLDRDRDDSDVDTDDYYNNHNYYSSSDTDETTSDCNYTRSVVPGSNGAAAGPSSAAAAAANNNGNASPSPVVAAPAPAPAVLACSVCGKEFRSRKAVCGHMKVHQQGTISRRHEQQQGIGKEKDKGIKRSAAVAGGWGGTGKRGGTGCWSKPASPNARPDQSMAIVAANPNVVLQPMPLAYAAPNPLPSQSSVPMASGTPNPSSVPMASGTSNVSDESSSAKPTHSDAMETKAAVAGAGNPPTEAIVHQADAARAPPSPPPAELHAKSVRQQPIAPPPPDAEEERVELPPVDHPHPIAPPLAAAGRQNPNGYTCKQCGKWFPEHQGLGGHMAGHKNRELAAVPCRRDAKPEKVHKCRVCGAVFKAGVQLGGHMRMHYTGPPIVPNKKPRLAIQQALPPPAEQRALEPAPRPGVPGIVRLFGIDIVAGAGAGAQTPAAQAQEEGSSATQAAPSASNGGEQ